MSDIYYHNSLTGKTEKENVYGEAFLSFAYGNPLGKIALHALIKRSIFSRWYGWRMSRPESRKMIAPFIETYGLAIDEFADPADSYASFNDFFYRKLKAQSRPVDDDPRSLVFPADARHLAFANASMIDSVFVKGQCFDLGRLLQSDKLAAAYENGSLVLSRLCPVDYHRFHFPVAGVPSVRETIQGPLFSVSPIALRHKLSYLWQNKRTLTRLKTTHCGTVLLLEIGATCVGSIQQTYTSGQEVAKGAEKGFFAFGGSSTMVLFEPGAVRLNPELLSRSAEAIETYARMGMAMGSII